ncbi:HNH endonuclease [Natronomonas sp. F2-12]|jgi:hypothetical protein|uniref:HNH endonuclease n=1 Tax=Natronomonas aquatica TaxID=2841590 RepID=A0A9R1D5U1_9EURY|nr:hypothetical protein [Natronomonas aquatica]MCQ4333476.1 HNH endonuclease [Natronomonas aquatica]
MATTTEAECLDALREAAERLGESPTKKQYDELGLTPASTTICRILGSWNEAKGRAGLRTYTQDENGGIDVQPKPESVTIPDNEDWADLTAQQRWYYKNKQDRIETKECRRKQLREWFSQLKRKQYACERCAEGRSAAIDFHHPESKVAGVSQMVNHGYSKRRIRAEIERCTVLCANCHRKEHDEISKPVTPKDPERIEATIRNTSDTRIRKQRRAWVTAYKYHSDGCARCDASDPACLDFHHEGEKTVGIARMLSERRSLDDIRREIDNCVLLCANCHRVEHHARRKTDSV